MTPYYEEEGITIYHGDCREILPQLEPVDLVLTDPPYGIGDKMQGGTWGAAEKYADFRRWDVAPSAELLAAILGKARHSIIWGGNYFGLLPSRCWLVWDKQNAVKTMADCELAWTNLDKPSKRFSWPVGVHNWGHPTEKPLELFQWCIVQTNPDATIMDPFPAYILDPFMGSGTTLRAAKDLGRKAIGIEIEERYCEIAVKRLAQEVLPL
jgi:DNA modification methylase